MAVVPEVTIDEFMNDYEQIRTPDFARIASYVNHAKGSERNMAQFAEATGIGASTLSRIVNGRSTKPLSKEVIVPFLPDTQFDGVEFKVPVRGDKLSLLELSARNAKEMRFNALKQQEHTDPADRSSRQSGQYAAGNSYDSGNYGDDRNN